MPPVSYNIIKDSQNNISYDAANMDIFAIARSSADADTGAFGSTYYDQMDSRYYGVFWETFKVSYFSNSEATALSDSNGNKTKPNGFIEVVTLDDLGYNN